MLKKFLHPTLFLVGLFGAAAWIRSVDALPFWSWVRPKMASLRLSIDDYDTLFFGSSRVTCGLSPRDFDRQMHELGFQSRSFNCAVQGTHPHDFAALVDWVLRQQPRRLRRVVVELERWDHLPAPVNWLSAQEIESHDPGRLAARVRSVLRAGHKPFAERSDEVCHHVVHSLVNALCIGQGPRILDDVLARWRGGVAAVRRWPERGFAPPDDLEDPILRQRRADFVGQPDVADRAIAAKRLDIAPPELRGGFDHASLRELTARLRAAGVQPIYVVMPSFCASFAGRDGVAEVAKENLVLELDRPDDHPQLFAASLWYDSTHMNRAGAVAFSRYLAAHLVARRASGLKPLAADDTDTPVLDERPRLSATRTGAEPATITFAGQDVPPTGDVEVLVALAPANQPLGQGLVLQVALPAPLVVTMVRGVGGVVSGRGSLAGLPLDQPLYAQMCVRDRGVIVDASSGIRIDPPR